MRSLRSIEKWLRLPGRVALLLGLGALSTTAARAAIDAGTDALIAPAPVAQSESLGELSIRIEGTRIYLSESGGKFEELHLEGVVAAELLQQLLDNHDPARGTAVMRLNPLMLAGSGGAGFHWAPAPKDTTENRPAIPSAAPDGKAVTPKPLPSDTSGAPRSTMAHPGQNG